MEQEEVTALERPSVEAINEAVLRRLLALLAPRL